MPPAGSYRAAGVDLDEGRRALERIRHLVRTTFTPRVQSDLGSFAGFYAFPEADSDRLLVASMDGVGTKLKVAALAQSWRGVGWDLVAHCVDDILVHGARPLFFLDYIGTGRLSAAVVGEIMEGMAEACRLAGCALIGGETAEMPGFYAPGDLDLVGTIVGEVTRDKLVDGRAIRPGDVILGLVSSGLHTNGYSLARRVLDLEANPAVLEEPAEEDGPSWGDLLLQRHRMYLPAIGPLLDRGIIRGMAHITGGGILENLPRVLPPGTGAVIRPGSWEIPMLFRRLCERGGITPEEGFRVFNMGLGLLLVVSPEDRPEAALLLGAAGETPIEIGWIESGHPSVRWGDPEEGPPAGGGPK